MSAGDKAYPISPIVVAPKFTRSKSYFINDEGEAKPDPSQLRWTAQDSEVTQDYKLTISAFSM